VTFSYSTSFPLWYRATCAGVCVCVHIQENTGQWSDSSGAGVTEEDGSGNENENELGSAGECHLRAEARVPSCITTRRYQELRFCY